MSNDGGAGLANLLEKFHDALGADFVAHVATRLGEPQQQLRAAVEGMLPVLLGSLVERGSAGNAGTLLKSVASVPADPLMLEHPASLLTEDTGALERLTTMGPGLLGFLLGNKANALASAVGSASGIRTSSASWLGAVLAPLICALLYREVQQSRLDDSGLVQLLAAQREPLQAALDRRIVTAIGIAALNRLLPEQTAASAQGGAATAESAALEQGAVPSAQSSGPGQPVALWIVLALIVLAVLGYFAAR